MRGRGRKRNKTNEKKAVDKQILIHKVDLHNILNFAAVCSVDFHLTVSVSSFWYHFQ